MVPGIGILVVRTGTIIPGDARPPLPFLGSTGQSRRRFHCFICAFMGRTVGRRPAVSNVLTQLDCRNTGKKLNERIVASSTDETCGCHDAG